MKPGKLQMNHYRAQSFVLCSHTLAELRSRHISIG